MQTRSLIAKLLLAAFFVTAVFGLYATAFSTMHHEMGCPFAPGNTAMCDAALTHLSHWQSAFAAVLGELLLLASAVVICFFSIALGLDAPHYSRYRSAKRVPLRPPPLQELFSQGILHRKEPQIAQ